MPTRIGKYTLQMDKSPGILGFASIAGKKEKEGPLGAFFDVSHTDNTLGDVSWEKAESQLQTEAVETALKKAALEGKDVDYILAGDLLNQCISSTFGLRSLGIPFLGQYGACSTMAQTLGLASLFVETGIARRAVAVTSSHFCSAERQFRFPLEYANQRPKSATWTVTGSGAYVLGKKRSKARITGITTGKIVDYGIKDSMNMGAAMAPAASDVICRHLSDFGRNVTDYDKIITGDLGKVGQEILWDLTRTGGDDISIHTDCGIEIYDADKQGTGAGGSGCGCAAVTLSAHFMRQIEEGKWKRILFVPTGALLSTVSFNEGMTVPGIAHAVVIEHAG